MQKPPPEKFCKKAVLKSFAIVELKTQDLKWELQPKRKRWWGKHAEQKSGLKIVDTRPNIVHLLAVNRGLKPCAKISPPSIMEFHWSSMYCSETIIVINSYLTFSLPKR